MRAAVSTAQRYVVLLEAPSLADRVRVAGGHASETEMRGWTATAVAQQEQFLARLSAGEFVMRAAAVRAYGVDFFEALNGLRAPNPPRRGATVPRFAEGGLVGTPAAGGETSLVVGLEDGLVARKLETTEGTRSIIRVIERNANTIRRALRL